LQQFEGFRSDPEKTRLKGFSSLRGYKESRAKISVKEFLYSIGHTNSIDSIDNIDSINSLDSSDSIHSVDLVDPVDPILFCS